MTVEALEIPIEIDLSPFNKAMQSVNATVAKPAKAANAQIVTSLEGVQNSLENVSSVATDVTFDLNSLSRAFNAVAVASKPLSIAGNHLNVVGAAASLAARGASSLAGTFSLVSTVVTQMAIGLGILIAPLRGLVIVPKLVAAAFSVMFAVILAPFKLMATAVRVAVKGLWALLQPVLAVANAVFRLKVSISSLQLQFALMAKFLSVLPPQVRALVVGLVALGAAGRAGTFASNLAGAAVRGLGFALLTVTQPVRALIVSLKSGALGFARFSLSAVRAARSTAKLTLSSAIAGMRGLGKAATSVAARIGGSLVGGLQRLRTSLAAIAVVGAVWGINLSANAEQAEVAFTTMLKSSNLAKAVLSELEQFAASTPFQLNSLRDGAKQLLNAQVTASNLTDRLRMLGDIAAGTGKPIGDFVRIFAKVKSTGKVSLETLNQLAERGVPIYSALQAQLGKSREEMLQMISRGKVGFTELDGALTSMATGAGVFAGGMAAQSQTLSGLFSTLKDNVSFAMRALGTEIISAFNFKSLMATGITFFQSLKSGIASARPAFVATANVVSAAFNAVWEVVATVFGSISNAFGLTSGNLMTGFLEIAAVASFAFKNWPTIAELAFTQLRLFIVQAGSQFMHLFTGVLPALFTWFGENWRSVFETAANLVGTVFTNITTNIQNAMTAIWDFIASGGTASLEFAWTPLLDGFKNTVKELPDIPERAVGELEKKLLAQSDSLGSALSTGLADEIANNLKMLDDFQAKNIEAPEIDATTGLDTATVDPAEQTASTQNQRSSFAIDSLDRGSEAALKAIFSGQGNKTAEKQLAESKKQTKSLNAIASRDTVDLQVAGAVT